MDRLAVEAAYYYTDIRDMIVRTPTGRIIDGNEVARKIREELVRDIEATFLSSGIEPPSPKTVVGADKVGQGVYRLLLESGRLVRLKTYDRKSELVLHASALENVKQAIAREFPYPAAFALKDIRDLLGSTRKYIVPLMEHLDASGATVRRGDLRRLREQQEA